MNELIYGQDDTKHIVAIEVEAREVNLFKNDGSVEQRPYTDWILTNAPLPTSEKLEGELPFRFITNVESRNKFFDLQRLITERRMQKYVVYNKEESAMIRGGFTLFKGLKVSDVSVLAFDIEATGLAHDETAEVLLISNTFRDGAGRVTKQLFDISNFDNCADMINAWCLWVQRMNPSVLCGHNIFGYDLPYLNYCSQYGLQLGRDGSAAYFEDYVRQKRKDGSQSYDFNDVRIFGRQVIDTMFLAYDYDFARKYKSYGLKQIVKQEGLERDGRTHWDFDDKHPRDIRHDETLWAHFRDYCRDDGDDALALYDLMIPSFFYWAQSVPMNLQQIVNTATGRQLNNFLIRSYLQLGHSVPMKSEKEAFEGAISFGNPGLYQHVLKVDVASLYPSIIRTYQIYDAAKDPKAHFLKMVEFFTEMRLKNKRLAKETGDRYYKDLEQSQKIAINSAYGLLGTPGLNFNSPKNASDVTRHGREILQTGIKWVEDRGYQLVNVDTDSFSYTKGSKVDKDEFNADIDDINTLYDDGISWEDDGSYKSVLVIKSKNYVLVDYDDHMTFKGSAFKDAKKEPALRELLNDMVHSMINMGKIDHDTLINIYHNYLREALAPADINRWAGKVTVTKSVLTGEGTRQVKQREALQGRQFSEGDKVYMYPAIVGYEKTFTKTGKPRMTPVKKLKLVEDYAGDADIDHLLKRVYSTACILENVVDKNVFVNYSLKRNRGKLEEVLNG